MEEINNQNHPVQPENPPQGATEAETVKPINNDVENNKLLAVIAYLGILCLVPLLLKKESPFAQFHGKQGLVLLLAWIIVNVGMIVPFVGWITGFFGNIICFILMIVGIVHAAKGEMKQLPWIGGFEKSLNL